MDNTKKKIFDITSIGGTDLFGTIIAAGFWLFIASELGPKNYGEITFFISIATLISGIALFGSNNTILVLVAKKIKIQSTIFIISIVANIVGAIIIFIIFSNIGLSFVIIAYSIFTLVTFDLLGQKLFKNYSRHIIIQKIFLLIFGIGLYYVIGENGILIGIALSHTHFIVHILKTFKNSKIDFKLIKEKKKFIFNNFVLSISKTFSGSIDKIIIAPLLGFMILGNYSLGLQFFAILNLLPAVCVKYLVTQNISGISNKMLKKIMVLVSIILAIIGTTLGPKILSYIFPKFLEAQEIIQIIGWAIIPVTIQSVYFYSKFWAAEQNKIIIFSSIITISIQIIGIVLIGSMYGGVGIAIVFLISNVCSLISTIIMDKIWFKVVD